MRNILMQKTLLKRFLVQTFDFWMLLLENMIVELMMLVLELSKSKIKLFIPNLFQVHFEMISVFWNFKKKSLFHQWLNLYVSQKRTPE